MSFAYDVKKSEIYIYDAIGDPEWGMIGAMQVVDALKKMEGKRVTVRINSPGGSVDEGVAIFNALKRHNGGVKTVVDSLAASMASYVMLAGVERSVASNARVMIHNPWSIAMGNADEFRKAAEVLDKYAQSMLPDYAAYTGKTVDEVKALLDAETWYVGQEIIDNGFAHSLDGETDLDPVLKGLKTIAAKSIAAGTAPKALFEKRVTAISKSIDPRPRLTAAKVALMQMQAEG